MNLARLRKQIDRTDQEIVGLLNKRANVTLEIARLKQKLGISVYCPDREREVLRKIVLFNRGPLPRGSLETIYREIMSGSLALEKPLQIAFMGPEATFSHQAALKRFGSSVEYIPCESINDVFVSVEKDNADYGVVPVENSIEGAVNYTLDMFMDSDLKICAQVMLDISHNLLGCCARNKIKRVYSNPQVFGQCRLWLRQHLPGAELIEVSSTTRAAQICAREKASACIASLLAAKLYGLRVIARAIEDSPHNITKFFVIGKETAPRTGNDKTSIMFSIKDKVGALHAMLVPFKRHAVNLSKIESRPSKRKAWDYYFFADLQGHVQDPRIGRALQELESKCKFLKVLGSYPVGT